MKFAYLERAFVLAICFGSLFGCAGDAQLTHRQSASSHSGQLAGDGSSQTAIEQVGYADEGLNGQPARLISQIEGEALFSESLSELEQQSQQNPTLVRLSREYQAARAKVRYIDELPDPKLGANFFISPIETAAGSQRANLTLSQMLPWLPRLDAQLSLIHI